MKMKLKLGSFEIGKELLTTAQRLLGIQRTVRFCRSSSKVAVLKKTNTILETSLKKHVVEKWNTNWIKQKYSIVPEKSTTIHITKKHQFNHNLERMKNSWKKS